MWREELKCSSISRLNTLTEVVVVAPSSAFQSIDLPKLNLMVLYYSTSSWLFSINTPGEHLNTMGSRLHSRSNNRTNGFIERRLCVLATIVNNKNKLIRANWLEYETLDGVAWSLGTTTLLNSQRILATLAGLKINELDRQFVAKHSSSMFFVVRFDMNLPLDDYHINNLANILPRCLQVLCLFFFFFFFPPSIAWPAVDGGSPPRLSRALGVARKKQRQVPPTASKCVGDSVACVVAFCAIFFAQLQQF